MFTPQSSANLAAAAVVGTLHTGAAAWGRRLGRPLLGKVRILEVGTVLAAGTQGLRLVGTQRHQAAGNHLHRQGARIKVLASSRNPSKPFSRRYSALRSPENLAPLSRKPRGPGGRTRAKAQAPPVHLAVPGIPPPRAALGRAGLSFGSCVKYLKEEYVDDRCLMQGAD